MYITNFDKRTPSSTKGCLALSLCKMLVLADKSDTKTHSDADPSITPPPELGGSDSKMESSDDSHEERACPFEAASSPFSGLRSSGFFWFDEG